MTKVPGCNVLKTAFKVIYKTQLLYYKAVGRNTNSVGQYITTYAAAVYVSGSWQPVEKRKYTMMGLDLQKSYFYLYIPKYLLDLERDISADQLAFQGIRYQIQSRTEWFGVDGWLELLCVGIGRDTAALDVFGFNSMATPNGQTNFSGGNFAPAPGEGPPHDG